VTALETASLPAVGERLPEYAIGPFDAQSLARYAEVSGDDNPIHLDDSLALAIGLAAPPVQGMKLLAAFEPMLRAWRKDLVVARLSGTFVQPALRGEKITLSGRVVRSSPQDGVLVRLHAYGASRAPAVIAEATLTPAANGMR
jgi:acyl dehydratase